MYDFRITPTALVKRDHTRRFDISGAVRKPTVFLLEVTQNDSVIASRKF